MRFLKDRGFVLRRINFGDSDRYVTLFSENHGKIEVVAKGIRKITSHRTGATEPLNLIEFQTVKSAKNHILTEVKLINSFDHLKRELSSIRKVFLMCELIDAVLPLGVRHDDIFDLIERAGTKMLENEKNMAYFQAKLLSILGFWDNSASFKNEAHVTAYVEEIIEHKLRSASAFTSESTRFDIK